MTKHTPGPWFSEKGFRDGTCKVFEIQDNEGLLLAEVIKNGDAHLIAAAPDLLAALRTAEAALTDIARGDYSDPLCQRTPKQCAREALLSVHAAIAKARGQG